MRIPVAPQRSLSALTLAQNQALASFVCSRDGYTGAGANALHPLYAEAYRRARETVLTREHARLTFVTMN